MKKIIALVTLTFFVFAVQSCQKEPVKNQKVELPKPWKSMNLKIDGAIILKADSGDIQIHFPFIKAKDKKLAYAMILQAIKDSGWKVIKQEYGREGEFESTEKTRWGVEVFDNKGKTTANIWKK